MTLPTLFIASSSEGLGVAHDIQEAVEFDCHATLWPQGPLDGGLPLIDALHAAVARQDFALAVLTPDDRLHRRGLEHVVPRDNVVFDLGMAIGLLGLERCALITPRLSPPVSLPSDLAGVLALAYADDRPDGNRLAALGPACNKLRRRLQGLPSRHGPVASLAPAPQGIDRWLQAWDSEALQADRARLRAGIVVDSTGDDPERASLRRIFHFLDAMADAVLRQDLDEALARKAFGAAVASVWPMACTLLAPPNQADEFWQPLPPLARLALHWT